MTEIPQTIFHITHWKAGSQWVAEILKHSAPERFVPWKIADVHGFRGFGTPSFFIDPLIPGRIYGTVYLPLRRFQNIISGFVWRAMGRYHIHPRRSLFNIWNFKIKQSPYRTFLVIRDLRDTLISLYFSTKYSHEESPSIMAERRQALNSLEEEQGLIYSLDEILTPAAHIQSSWIGDSDVLLLRYEDILGNEYAFFERLMEYCRIDIDRERLYDIVRYNLFEAATGRKRGQEDIHAHLRKGVAGDWREHFTERVKVEFKSRFGRLLIDTGYEKDLDW